MESEVIFTYVKNQNYLTVKNGKFTGVFANLYLYLVSSLQLNSTIKTPTDEGAGVETRNGRWSSLIGLLQRKEADVGLGQLVMFSKRFKAIDYSNPIGAHARKFLVGRPVSLSTSILTWVFSEQETKVFQVYMLTFLAFAVVSLIFTRILLNQDRELRSPIKHIFALLGLSVFQSVKIQPETISRRVLVSVWMLGTVVMSPQFCGALVSSFIVDQNSKFIKTVEDFFKFPNVLPIIVKGGIDETFFRDGNQSWQKEIYSRCCKNKGGLYSREGVFKNDTLLDSIETGNSAIGSIEPWLFDLLRARSKKHDSCKFRLTESYSTGYSAVGFRKNLSKALVESINVRILRFTAANLFQYKYPPVPTTYLRCLDEKQSKSYDPLSLLQDSFFFLLWIAGILISVSIFMIEVVSICFRYASWKYRTRTKAKVDGFEGTVSLVACRTQSVQTRDSSLKSIAISTDTCRTPSARTRSPSSESIPIAE